MRNLTFLSIVTMTLLTSCYTYRPITNSFPEPITKTYEVSGAKDDLFVKSNLWMVSAFKDAKSVIQYSDKTEGILTGKYLLEYQPSSSGMILGNYYNIPEVTIYAIIEIRVKDGKAYISVNPESWTYTQAIGPDGKEKTGMRYYTKEMAVAEIDALCESFNKSLRTEKVDF